MQSNDIILDIQGVSVSFDGFKALNNLSLTVKKNQMIAIIGPNGAGKTTLQDVITGKTKIEKGNIFFKNNNLNQFSEHEITNLGIGRKFQRPSVIDNITVWRVINYYTFNFLENIFQIICRNKILKNFNFFI